MTTPAVRVRMPSYHFPPRARAERSRRAGSVPPPTLAGVADVEYLLDTLRLADTKGGGHGIDGITYSDLSRWEWPQLFRDLAADVRAGSYRPQPFREQDIPRASGGTRTLSIPTVADRVLSKAVERSLSRVIDPTFHTCSYGFRPGRSTHTMLADLASQTETTDRWAITADDIRRAFDNIEITHAIEELRRPGVESGLVSLVEVMARGSDRKEVGIAQGDPLSPLLLNVLLHARLDTRVIRDVGSSVAWYARYVDNLVLVTRDASEGRAVLDRIRSSLVEIGLDLKGDPGVPRELQRGEHLELLGFRLGRREGRLRFEIPNRSWTDLAGALADCHTRPNPAEAARSLVRSWISAYDPTFDLQSIDESTNRLQNLLNRKGFGHAMSKASIRQQANQACQGWMRRRRATTLTPPGR